MGFRHLSYLLIYIVYLFHVCYIGLVPYCCLFIYFQREWLLVFFRMGVMVGGGVFGGVEELLSVGVVGVLGLVGGDFIVFLWRNVQFL